MILHTLNCPHCNEIIDIEIDLAKDEGIKPPFYAAGYYNGDYSYGMFAVSPKIEDVLYIEPDHNEIRDVFIVLFQQDDSHNKIKKWNKMTREWNNYPYTSTS